MSKEKENKGYPKSLVVIEVIILAAYAVLCGYLYYMQTLKLPEYRFESDLPYHIEMALDGWGYSVTAIVYRLLSFLPGSGYLIAVFLSACTVGAICVTQKTVAKYVPNVWLCFLIALASGFVMPFFIKAVQYSRYLGYQSGTIWHNSTYIVMKLFAAMTLMVYFSLAKRYAEKLTVKDWIVFAGLLVLTTATKTSFVLVFAPAAFLLLTLDLYLKVPLRKVLLVALTVLPTMLVIMLQRTILFGEDTGNGIAIDFAYAVYQTTGRPYLTMPLSLFFPLVILAANAWGVCKDTFLDLKKRDKTLKHREYITAWLMWFFAFLEYVFLTETGNRHRDGNFLWGYSFVIFVLFVVSMVYFLNNLKNSSFAPKAVRIVYGVTAGGVLGYHIFCGIFFFVRLLSGYTYFL